MKFLFETLWINKINNEIYSSHTLIFVVVFLHVYIAQKALKYIIKPDIWSLKRHIAVEISYTRHKHTSIGKPNVSAKEFWEIYFTVMNNFFFRKQWLNIFFLGNSDFTIVKINVRFIQIADKCFKNGPTHLFFYLFFACLFFYFAKTKTKHVFMIAYFLNNIVLWRLGCRFLLQALHFKLFVIKRE